MVQDAGAIRLTKKFIICGKHGYNPEDFPKYEEKPVVSVNSGKNKNSMKKIVGSASGSFRLSDKGSSYGGEKGKGMIFRITKMT